MSNTRIVTELTDIDIRDISDGCQEITVSFIWGELKIERTKTFSKVTYSVKEWMTAENGVCAVDYGMNNNGSISISEACRGN